MALAVVGVVGVVVVGFSSATAEFHQRSPYRGLFDLKFSRLLYTLLWNFHNIRVDPVSSRNQTPRRTKLIEEGNGSRLTWWNLSSSSSSNKINRAESIFCVLCNVCHSQLVYDGLGRMIDVECGRGKNFVLACRKEEFDLIWYSLIPAKTEMSKKKKSRRETCLKDDEEEEEERTQTFFGRTSRINQCVV